MKGPPPVRKWDGGNSKDILHLSMQRRENPACVDMRNADLEKPIHWKFTRVKPFL